MQIERSALHELSAEYEDHLPCLGRSREQPDCPQGPWPHRPLSSPTEGQSQSGLALDAPLDGTKSLRSSGGRCRVATAGFVIVRPSVQPSQPLQGLFKEPRYRRGGNQDSRPLVVFDQGEEARSGSRQHAVTQNHADRSWRVICSDRLPTR